MIHYTDHLTRLMRDIVSRVETLSFIDVADLLVFARLAVLAPAVRLRPAIV